MTGFVDTMASTSADPADGPPGWIERLSQGRGSCASTSFGRPSRDLSRPPIPPTPPAPHTISLRSTAAVRDAEARGLAVLLTSGPQPGRRDPGARHRQLLAPGSRTPPSSPTSCGRSRPATRAASTPTAPARRRCFLPSRRCRSGTSPTSPSLTPQYEGQTAFSPAHYREMLNAAYSAVKAVDPKMLVVTAGTSPYGDPPGGNRVRPVDVLAGSAVRARGEEEEAKKKKKGASKRVFVRTQNCPAPARFDVLAHHPINTSGGPRRRGNQPGRRLKRGPRSDRARAARRRERRDGSAGSASALGDGVLVGQQPPEPRRRPARSPSALDRAGDVPGLAGWRQRGDQSFDSRLDERAPRCRGGRRLGHLLRQRSAQALIHRLPLPLRHRADRQAEAARLGQGSGRRQAGDPARAPADAGWR